MIVEVAKTSGFCGGVKRAVMTATKLVQEFRVEKEAEPVYMLGPVVHNEQVVKQLQNAGMVLAHDVEEIPEGAKVLIRAHGIKPEIFQKLEEKKCSVIDRTCPYVEKIHQIVGQESLAGAGVIIVGDQNHPEITGIIGHITGTYVVIRTEEEAETLEFSTRNWILVSQTTFSLQKFNNIAIILKKKITNLQIFGTICSTIENRQSEAEILAKNNDLIFVVGSAHSSNTVKLVELSKKVNALTFLIERPDQVAALLKGRDLSQLRIGVIAGASTPEEMIEEVIQAMADNEGMRNQEEQVDVNFSEFIDSIPQLKRGTTVKGVIVRYDDEFVYVDVRDKSEGRIPRHEFDNDPDFDLDQAIEAHTEIDVYVRNIRNSDMGKEITLSKARVDFSKYKDLIADAFKNRTPIMVKVSNVVKDGVIANYGGIDIYIHRTQLDIGKVDDLEPYRDMSFEVLITQYDPDKKRLRVAGSRRALENGKRKEQAKELWSTIEEGAQYDGIIRSLTNFGVFVDIGGVDGLVHISELSWDRIHHPSEVVSVGDEIRVYVKGFDEENRRISLGYKKTEEDPYANIEERFPVGSIIHGKVVRMFPFGAFVQIAPGIDALCHISQISDVRLNKPNDVLSEGMEVDARILEVNNDNRRISISIKEVEAINPEGAVIEPEQKRAPKKPVQEEKTFNADGTEAVYVDPDLAGGEGASFEDIVNATEAAAKEESVVETVVEEAVVEEAVEAVEEAVAEVEVVEAVEEAVAEVEVVEAVEEAVAEVEAVEAVEEAVAEVEDTVEE